MTQSWPRVIQTCKASTAAASRAANEHQSKANSSEGRSAVMLPSVKPLRMQFRSVGALPGHAISGMLESLNAGHYGTLLSAGAASMGIPCWLHFVQQDRSCLQELAKVVEWMALYVRGNAVEALLEPLSKQETLCKLRLRLQVKLSGVPGSLGPSQLDEKDFSGHPRAQVDSMLALREQLFLFRSPSIQGPPDWTGLNTFLHEPRAFDGLPSSAAWRKQTEEVMSANIMDDFNAMRWPIGLGMCDAMAWRLIELQKLKQLKPGQQLRFKSGIDFSLLDEELAASSTVQHPSDQHQSQAPSMLTASTSTTTEVTAQQTSPIVSPSGVCQLSDAAAAAQAEQGSSRRVPSLQSRPSNNFPSEDPAGAAAAAAAPQTSHEQALSEARPSNANCDSAASPATAAAAQQILSDKALSLASRSVVRCDSAASVAAAATEAAAAHAHAAEHQASVLHDAEAFKQHPLGNIAAAPAQCDTQAKDGYIHRTMPRDFDEEAGSATCSIPSIKPLHHSPPDRAASPLSEAQTRAPHVQQPAGEQSHLKPSECKTPNMSAQRSSSKPFRTQSRGFRLKRRLSWHPEGYRAASTLCMPSTRSPPGPGRQQGVTMFLLSQKEVSARIDAKAPSEQAAAAAKLQAIRAMKGGCNLRGMPAWLRNILTSNSQAIMPDQPEGLSLTKSDLACMMSSLADFAREFEAEAETPGQAEAGRLLANYAEGLRFQAKGKKQLKAPTSSSDAPPAYPTGRDTTAPEQGPSCSAAAAAYGTDDAAGCVQQPDVRLVTESADSSLAASSARPKDLKSSAAAESFTRVQQSNGNPHQAACHLRAEAAPGPSAPAVASAHKQQPSSFSQQHVTSPNTTDASGFASAVHAAGRQPVLKPGFLLKPASSQGQQDSQSSLANMQGTATEAAASSACMAGAGAAADVSKSSRGTHVPAGAAAAAAANPSASAPTIQPKPPAQDALSTAGAKTDHLQSQPAAFLAAPQEWQQGRQKSQSSHLNVSRPAASPPQPPASCAAEASSDVFDVEVPAMYASMTPPPSDAAARAIARRAKLLKMQQAAGAAETRAQEAGQTQLQAGAIDAEAARKSAAAANALLLELESETAARQQAADKAKAKISKAKKRRAGTSSQPGRDAGEVERHLHMPDDAAYCNATT